MIGLLALFFGVLFAYLTCVVDTWKKSLFFFVLCVSSFVVCFYEVVTIFRK